MKKRLVLLVALRSLWKKKYSNACLIILLTFLFFMT